MTTSVAHSCKQLICSGSTFSTSCHFKTAIEHSASNFTTTFSIKQKMFLAFILTYNAWDRGNNQGKNRRGHLVSSQPWQQDGGTTKSQSRNTCETTCWQIHSSLGFSSTETTGKYVMTLTLMSVEGDIQPSMRTKANPFSSVSSRFWTSEWQKWSYLDTSLCSFQGANLGMRSREKCGCFVPVSCRRCFVPGVILYKGPSKNAN